MSTSHIAKGPLHVLLGSTSGQWVALGAGAVAFFPEKVDLLLGTSFRHGLSALASMPAKAADHVASTSSPIVIHTTGSSHPNGGVVTTLVTYSVGAGAIWVVYMVATNMLPEWAQDMMPVSRNIFNTAIQNLGKGIIGVKDALSKQIFNLSTKQDDLAKKQDETHNEVLNLHTSLDEARQDLTGLGEALGRCEGQLESAERLQLYTSKGVKLLVRCVANVLPGNDRVMSDLLEFTKEGEQFRNKGNGNSAMVTTYSAQQQEINKLTQAPSQSQLALRAIMEEKQQQSSPENEHHPVVVTPMRQSSMSSTDSSVEDMQELMQLVREGKIRTRLQVA